MNVFRLFTFNVIIVTVDATLPYLKLLSIDSMYSLLLFLFSCLWIKFFYDSILSLLLAN